MTSSTLSNSRADGAAAYQALFSLYTPQVVAVIQSGTGFGGNYTDYCDPNELFAKSVRATGNTMPKLLLNGGVGYREYYKDPIWPEDYSNNLGWLGGNERIHVWSRVA